MQTSPKQARFFAVVPAAGSGRRMGGNTPKQYLEILGRPVIEHTLETLLKVAAFETIVVAVAAEDDAWRQLSIAGHSKIQAVEGGVERSDSVLNGLLYLSTFADANDWVLVHDVARPCVQLSDIEGMMHHFVDDPVGGILAVPVSDTIKQVDRQLDVQVIRQTVDRAALWQAQTPQMFRLGGLQAALQKARDKGIAVTDEAAAMELAGYHPAVYQGARSNIKITRPEDLALAEYFLSTALSAGKGSS